MKQFIKKIMILSLGIVVLTSATIAPKTGLVINPKTNSITEPSATTVTDPKVAALNTAIEEAKLDGKVTKTELKKLATIAKGSKLSFKEKLVLNLFGKKLSSKIMDTNTSKAGGSGGKSQIVALLLCIFVGGIGIHRFYLGYTWQGIVQILTLGGLGIWTLIDLVRIIMGSLKPKGGEYEKTL